MHTLFSFLRRNTQTFQGHRIEIGFDLQFFLIEDEPDAYEHSASIYEDAMSSCNSTISFPHLCLNSQSYIVYHLIDKSRMGKTYCAVKKQKTFFCLMEPI